MWFIYFDHYDQLNIKYKNIIGTNGSTYKLSKTPNKCFWPIHHQKITYVIKNITNHICFTKGEQIPKKIFRSEAKAKGTDDKPWVPSLHPVALFRVPVCIPKVRGYQVKTGIVTKPNVRSSLQKYTRLAVDWLDVMTSHRVSTKYAKYDMFDTKYLPKTQMKSMFWINPIFSQH